MPKLGGDFAKEVWNVDKNGKIRYPKCVLNIRGVIGIPVARFCKVRSRPRKRAAISEAERKK